MARPERSEGAQQSTEPSVDVLAAQVRAGFDAKWERMDAENVAAHEALVVLVGYAKRAEEVASLRDAVRRYILAISRAPNNRDEAEIEAAAEALVAAAGMRDV